MSTLSRSCTIKSMCLSHKGWVTQVKLLNHSPHPKLMCNKFPIDFNLHWVWSAFETHKNFDQKRVKVLMVHLDGKGEVFPHGWNGLLVTYQKNSVPPCINTTLVWLSPSDGHWHGDYIILYIYISVWPLEDSSGTQE